MTLTKTQISEEVWSKTDNPKWRSAELVVSVFGVINRALESGENVMISGFGKFCVKEKNERRGRNPATGSEMTLPAKKVVTFKYSEKLKERINGK